jgi:hypothetical protein
MSVEYIGHRSVTGCSVVVLHSGPQPGTTHEEALNPRLDLLRKSPTGLDWGYSGSGPAQLAVAILAHCVGDVLALKHFQAFKLRYVCHFPHDHWTMTADEVRSAVQRLMLD